LRPSFNVDELSAICEEAHKFGKHAAAHCASSQGMINALDAGIDTIIHGLHREPDGTSVYRPEISARIAEAGVFVNATLAGARVRIQTMEDRMEAEGLSDEEEAQLDLMRDEHEIRLEHFLRMREAGVVMVAGSDSAWGNYKMGNHQAEIETHVTGGMTTMEAIVATTRDAAKSCWIDDRVGTLEEGKLADILVVDGDPIARIEDLRNVTDVYLDGGLVNRGDFV
jgi:imidazolonepropionase-like amidohydrolase